MSEQSKTFKQYRSGNFTVVDNNILRNRNISLKAKGLLILLLSLPPTWEFSERGLTVLSKDGRTSVRSGLKELEAEKHLTREPIRSEDGQFIGYKYNIYELPTAEEQNPRTSIPRSGNRTSGTEPNKVLSNKELKELSTKEVKSTYARTEEKEVEEDKNKKIKPPKKQPLSNKYFNEFWEKYPKKTAKGKARESFKKNVKTKEVLEEIIVDLENRKNFEGWQDPRYIPYPATYLNGERWNDEYETDDKYTRDYKGMESQPEKHKAEEDTKSEEEIEAERKIQMEKHMKLIERLEKAQEKRDREAQERL